MVCGCPFRCQVSPTRGGDSLRGRQEGYAMHGSWGGSCRCLPRKCDTRKCDPRTGFTSRCHTLGVPPSSGCHTSGYKTLNPLKSSGYHTSGCHTCRCPPHSLSRGVQVGGNHGVDSAIPKFSGFPGPTPYRCRLGPKPYRCRLGPTPYRCRLGPTPYRCRLGPKPYRCRLGPTPYRCRLGPTPYRCRLGPKPWPTQAPSP